MEKLQAAIQEAKKKRRAQELQAARAGAAQAPDREPEAGPDTGPVSGADTGPDTGPDMGPGAVTDRPAERAAAPVSAPVSTPVSAPVAPPEGTPETGPETRPEAGPASGPASGPTPAELRRDWAALTPFKPSPRILRRHRICPPGETGAETAPYDMLRTRILHRMRKEGWRRLLITSPGPGCGKSTVAANLAISVARNPELRVMLFDTDLRRPALGQMFGLRRRSSFHEALSGQELFEDHALRIGPNLALTSNHVPARNSAELLQSDRAVALLDEIEARYRPDLMIFDMPPLLGSDDTHAFLPQADCALILAAAESTRIDQIDTVEKDLAQHLPVLGVTLTKCRYTDSSYGYGPY